MQDETDYSKEFTEESFWEKVQKGAKTVGRELVEKVLFLYYAFQDKDTPAWAKAVIIGALGYFIFPLDAIPDALPGVGYADDAGVIAVALGIVTIHIKPEHKDRAKAKTDEWFS